MQSVQATLSDVIGAIGKPDFVADIAASLRRFAGFDLAAFVLHPAADVPSVLFDNFDEAGCRGGVTTYARITYRANPMLAGRGAVRARDYAGKPARAIAELHPYLLAAPEEELGFRTTGWPERQEEIGLYLPGRDGLIELGFYRARALHPVSDATLNALNQIAQPLAAAFDRHRALTRYDRQPWRDLLTQREREVVELLRLGCSSDAIALRLGLSRHTVKDHRKHIFRKLGIASIQELFAAIH